MDELERFVQRVSRNYQNTIDDLIKPLDHIFDIDAHAYYRIDSEGFVTYLSNLPEISEYYFANKLYAGNPFLKHPSLINEGCVFAGTVDNSDYQHGQSLVEKKFELNNHLHIFVKEGDILHAHGFATTHRNEDIANVYINNLQRLLLFCRYFREETTQLQKKLEDSKVNLAQLMGSGFSSPQKIVGSQSEIESGAEFFSWLNKAYGGLKLIKPLTNRELECLTLILEGKSASLISKQLCVSVRTIEHHVETIKNKLSCSSKAEIFLFVKRLMECGGELSFLTRSWDTPY